VVTQDVTTQNNLFVVLKVLRYKSFTLQNFYATEFYTTEFYTTEFMYEHRADKQTKKTITRNGE
jgi:hypothetical protein